MGRRCATAVLLLLCYGSESWAKKSKANRVRRYRLNDREAEACGRIRYLLGSVSCEGFLTEYWEKKPLLSRQSAASAVANLFRSTDLPHMLNKWPMKINAEHGQVIFVRPNSFLHDEQFVQGSAVTTATVSEAMAAGDTVLIHNLEIYWKSVGMLSEQLSDFTNLYAQVNLYFSPPGSQIAVSLHQDAQDVFIIQLEGEKTWDLYSPKQALALKPQLRGKGGDVVRRDEVGQNLLQATLKSGDVLFVPRGVFHTTSTSTSTVSSLHLTVGMETDSDDLTWGKWLVEAINDVGSEIPMWDETSEMREALPLQALRLESSSHLSKQNKERAVTLLHKMLEKLVETDESIWHQALRRGLANRRDHVASKRKQLLRFRDLDMDSDEYDLPGAENEAEGEEDEKARDYKGNSWILDD